MEIFKLLGEVIVDTKEAIDSLGETKDAAEEASGSVDDLGNESKKSGKTTSDSISPIPAKFMKVANAAVAVVQKVMEIGKAMIELADSTRDYRKEMGKLESSFTSAGHTTEAATEVYRELQSVLGESEQAVEAAQHIAKLCQSEEEMKAMTQACTGVFAMFGASLPVEGLMEASNETAKTGQLTGALADALNWAGVSEDKFQRKLDKCNNERERTALIIEELNELYSDASDKYKEANEDIIAATSAQEELTAATARWGEVFEPVATWWRSTLASAINFAADAFDRLSDPAGAAAEEIVGVSESIEEAAEKVEYYKQRVEELAEFGWYDSDLNAALEEAIAQYEALAEAERKAAEEAAAAASAVEVEKFTEATEQYVTDAASLFEKFASTYESIYSSVSSWFGLFDKAKTEVKTNAKDMMSAMQSQIDFNETYIENLRLLKEYGLGGLADAFQSYGAEGAEYAKAIVKAVKDAGGAFTDEGKEIIQGFADMNQQVTDSREELSEIMLKMNGEVETELENVKNNFGEAIKDLDQSEAAKESAIATFEAFLEGMNSRIPAIMETVQSFGRQITSSLQGNTDNVGASLNIATKGRFIENIHGSHASGLDYVPFDGYIAELHKGEMVVPSDEASMLRNAGASSTQNGRITELLTSMLETNQEMLNALLSDKTFAVGEREFARLVKEYA